MFTLPKNGPVYTGIILERCQRLIRSGIWTGIKQTQFNIWLNNFQNDTERYFAACILDVFIYRSEEQTISMMRDLFDLELPSLAVLKQISILRSENLKPYLRAEPPQDERPVMIVPVIRMDEPPTKSGPMIARMLKQNLNINQNHIAWPWQVSLWKKKFGTEVVLFVDDLLGTGTQIKRFIHAFNLQESIEEMACVYCPLVAHEKGVKRVRKKFPSLSLVAAEHLGSSHSIFDPSTSPFIDSKNTIKDAQDFHSSLIERIKGPTTKQSIGYGNLALTYAFSHGTPNNTLPILWWSVPGIWNPLLKR